MSDHYMIVGIDGSKTAGIVTDDRERALTCAKALARAWPEVQVRHHGKTFIYPNLEKLP